MTLPDEVVKEINTFKDGYGAFDLERLALLTRRLTIEECAKVCDEYAYQWHKDYKIGHGEHRASQHREGMSDGASDLATRLRKEAK